MSLTSYRTAPPRVTIYGRKHQSRHCPHCIRCQKPKSRRSDWPAAAFCHYEWVLRAPFGFADFRNTPSTMPGGDLLFRRLSVSTIGAVRFHGRVRDGIGCVTDAMTTKQYRRCVSGLNRCNFLGRIWPVIVRHRGQMPQSAGLSLMVGFNKREQSY